MRRLAVAAAAALVLSPAARAGGPSMLLGATEDAVRAPTLAGAKADMDLLTLAGFRAVRITQVWSPGEVAVSAGDRNVLRNVAAAAELGGVTVLTSVVNAGSRTTPLTEQDQAAFASYAASVVRTVPSLRTVIVGNEPNLNRYWLPQFDEQGGDAAAPAYGTLLARTYDALKAASPGVTVVGGALAPRGGDVPNTIRPTHSPTAFIRDLAAWYRSSGRSRPLMDGLALHPYEDTSSIAPALGAHPNTTTIALADYDKLVALLGESFDGTAQAGSTLPIYYDEFGVESLIPPEKAHLYTGSEPATTKPVPESVQAEYYRQAVQLAFCQPNVRALMLFHVVDEPALPAWQSGVDYVDGTPKSSLVPTRRALDEARRGVVASCAGLELPVRPRVVQRGEALVLACDLDCTYVAQLYAPKGRLLLSRRGSAVGGRPTTLPVRAPRRSGPFRLRLSAVARVNTGPASLLRIPLRRP